VDGTWNNGAVGKPPNIFSHNVYTAEINADLTFDGMLSMRSSSVAAQMRVGGWYFDSVALDNQVSFQNSGVRNEIDEPAKASENGFLGINLRSVAVSARNSPYIAQPGARRMGFDFQGVQTVDVDCLIMHAADPDNPAEIAAKGIAEPAVSRGRGGLWSNLVIFGWGGDLNLTGLAASIIKTITIQRRAAQLLGVPNASIADYAEYVRGLSYRDMQLEIRAMHRYLLAAREGNLELPLADRTVPQVLTFKPDWRGEGFRSDSRINWSSGDTPIDGDSLNLHGNRVKWVKDTVAAGAITFGGGQMVVASGKLSAASHSDTADIEVIRCGKYHAPAMIGKAVARGGRLVLDGAATGDFEASGQGQMILGPNCVVPSGKRLRIVGDMGKVGWDGTGGTGSLTIQSGGVLEFHATPVLRFDLFNIDTWGLYLHDMKGVTSGATGKWDSWRRVGENAFVRVRDMLGIPVVGEQTITKKYIYEALGTISAILPATIGKIERFRSGRFGLTAPGIAGTVTLEVGSELVISNRDKLSPGVYDLGGGAGTGVTYVDQGAILPVGVTITGGKATLTIS
ncbi:hypothetical protein ACTJI6_19595, partial [Paracoccus sp. 22332]